MKNMTTRLMFNSSLIVMLTGTLLMSCLPKQFQQPNIILIMADDLGYADLGCYGNSDISTPALDKLAAQGMRFSDFHSNGAVCSPTRAALLTGRYQQRCGVEGVIYASGESRQTGLDVSEYTMADYLKSAGYATGIAGKWHLGYKIEYNPTYQGFDFFRGFVSGNVDYHSHVDNTGVPDWWFNLEKVEEKGYTTDLITDHALDFIEKNHDRPFFLYVAHAAPHAPFQGRKNAAERFPGARFTYAGSVTDKKAAYKEMVEVMDEGIERILRKLDEFRLREKTLIFFCSDNGGYAGYANNGSLRGSKGSLWEGGHRVPAIACWPGTIKAGSVSNQTIMTMDLFPTFINLSKSGLQPMSDLDGIDFTRLLIEQKQLPERTLYWKYRNTTSARRSDWKLLVSEDSIRLFNLRLDPEEQHDVSAEQSDMVNDLKTSLEKWEAEVMQGVQMRTR